jgi:hypothetical protein
VIKNGLYEYRLWYDEKSQNENKGDSFESTYRFEDNFGINQNISSVYDG